MRDAARAIPEPSTLFPESGHARNLAVSRDAAGLPVTFDPACNTSECDVTLTCTQFNCAPTHPDFCISL